MCVVLAQIQTNFSRGMRWFKAGTFCFSNAKSSLFSFLTLREGECHCCPPRLQLRLVVVSSTLHPPSSRGEALQVHGHSSSRHQPPGAAAMGAGPTTLVVVAESSSRTLEVVATPLSEEDGGHSHSEAEVEGEPDHGPSEVKIRFTVQSFAQFHSQLL